MARRGSRSRESKGDRDYVFGIRRVCKDVVYPHVFGSSDREVGGVLVGWSSSGGRMPVVTAAIPAISADEQRATLTFTQDSWEHIHRVMDADFPKDQIVGWYHSHPGFGIFLSDHDMFIQENFFNGPSQIALVVDPLAGTEGVFAWQDGKVVQCIDRGTPEPFAGLDPRRRIAGMSSEAGPEAERSPRRPGELPLALACVSAVTAGLVGLAIGFGGYTLAAGDSGGGDPATPDPPAAVPAPASVPKPGSPSDEPSDEPSPRGKDSDPYLTGPKESYVN